MPEPRKYDEETRAEPAAGRTTSAVHNGNTPDMRAQR